MIKSCSFVSGLVAQGLLSAYRLMHAYPEGYLVGLKKASKCHVLIYDSKTPGEMTTALNTV